MSNLPSYYTILFNAVTNALAALDMQNFGEAKALLIKGQQDAEEMYLNGEKI